MERGPYKETSMNEKINIQTHTYMERNLYTETNVNEKRPVQRDIKT